MPQRHIVYLIAPVISKDTTEIAVEFQFDKDLTTVKSISLPCVRIRPGECIRSAVTRLGFASGLTNTNVTSITELVGREYIEHWVEVSPTQLKGSKSRSIQSTTLSWFNTHATSEKHKRGLLSSKLYKSIQENNTNRPKDVILQPTPNGL